MDSFSIYAGGPLVAPRKLRLWKLGDLERRMFPTAVAIEHLAKMIEQNPTDIIWGPDVDVIELPMDSFDLQAIGTVNDAGDYVVKLLKKDEASCKSKT